MLMDWGLSKPTPNRDTTRYIEDYGLNDAETFYRGLLRYPGYCNSIQAIKDLDLFDDTVSRSYEGMSYVEFTKNLLGVESSKNIGQDTADKLNLKVSSDLIKQLRWLGIFEEREIRLTKGTNADILLDLMMEKMSYAEHEKDMIVVHNEVIAEFDNRIEKRTGTMRVEGRPFGHSAMSRAVSLPAAIASRLILEGTIRSKGVQMPTSKEIYIPVLAELAENGYEFKFKTKVM